jgi:hypothetical protein
METMLTMTTETTRLRGLLVMLAVFVPLTVVATAFTPGRRLFTAVAMTTVFTVLVVVIMAMWTFRPAWFVAWAGPMNDLHPEARQLVTRAVRLGEAVADPSLAQVTSTLARRSVRSAWVLIGAAALNIAIRVWFLAHARSASAWVLGTMRAGLWCGFLGLGVNRLIRSRRALFANLRVLKPAQTPQVG